MVTVIGVRFRNVGKIYYFDPKEFEIEVGDKVIVETARGVELGTVLLGKREVDEESIVSPLKPVERVASEEDIEHAEENRSKEKEACTICKEKIAKHGLDMKLVGAEYTFDNKKLLFYFTSDGRVDFRELVKDLAGVFRTRIELRQIGVRDEAKILGGLGICGRELCCCSYLSDFVPVSIKMAKEQGLPLNPMKISGNCGRLMCCLKNENETYKYLNSTLPDKGDMIITPTGREAKVEDLNVLRQQVVVLVEGEDDIKERQVFHIDEIKYKNHHKKEIAVTDEEEAELRDLEDIDEVSSAADYDNVASNNDGKPRNKRNKNKKKHRKKNPHKNKKTVEK
ncbi:MAG: stage 0 sporulation family protein [Lachnospiraceae bacterium]|nr:stage 0 sporulation family protein [Lachnospiraceae bacterium]